MTRLSTLPVPYKQRLYDAYVSSGQATLREVGSASAAQLFATNQPYVARIIRPLLPADKAATILDLGCGNGCYLYFIKQYGYTNLIGLDTSAEQVAIAQHLGISEVQQGDIDTYLTTYDKPTDLVLLMDMVEHLSRQETFDLLDRVYALLKPGGKLLLHVPNAEGLFGMQIRYGDLTHEQCFTPSSIRQLLNTIGFQHFVCCEDKPVVHGPLSLVRRVIWELGTLPFRPLLMAETGAGRAILSQNMLVVATK